MDKVNVLSIDIGISNLGFVWGNITFDPEDYTKERNYYKKNIINYLLDKSIFQRNIQIMDCNRINITNVKHNKVKLCDCTLRHDSCIPDYLDHFIQEHMNMFDDSDIILLERQPPAGITNVQDLLFTRFRDKVLLVSPNSVHKYFNMSKDYDTRKIESEQISSLFLCTFRGFIKNMRKHDISDSLLMIIYYYHTRFEEISRSIPRLSSQNIIDLESFRYC